MPRVVGIGTATVDLLGVVGRYPELDTKTDLESFSMQGGGPVATALAALSVLGVDTTLVAKIADDAMGQFILRGLRSLGVDASRVIVEPDAVSPLSFIAVDRQTGRRTIFHTRGSVVPPGAEDFDLALLDGASALLVDGRLLSLQVAACEAARERGIPVVLDAGSVREGMGELLALCDVLIASERFATDVAPQGEIEDSVVELSRLGPRTVIITLGEEGSVGLEGEKLVRTPALEVDVVDTTGAGDVYHGAYIYGMLQGWPLEKSMRFASAAAGLKCRALGGRAGLASLDEVRAAAFPESG